MIDTSPLADAHSGLWPRQRQAVQAAPRTVALHDHPERPRNLAVRTSPPFPSRATAGPRDLREVSGANRLRGVS